jgi:hypothetical protein
MNFGDEGPAAAVILAGYRNWAWLALLSKPNNVRADNEADSNYPDCIIAGQHECISG